MNSIEEVIRESVIEDLGDHDSVNTTELTKQGKKPFKRKPDGICDIIEIDCDDSDNIKSTAPNSSLETKKTKLDSSTEKNWPILTNLLLSNENQIMPYQTSSSVSPRFETVQVPAHNASSSMKSQICLIFIFHSETSSKSYFGLVLDGGTLFLPNKMEYERREIMSQTKSVYTLNMKKVDPKRKSFDTVEIVVSNNISITVEKPGSGIFVLQKIKNQEPFYVTQGGLSRIAELHKAIRNGKDWIVDLKVLKMCRNIQSSVINEEDIIDLRYLKGLSKDLKNQGIRKIIFEFHHLKHSSDMYPFKDGTSFELFNCAFCGTKFDYAVEHMYHLFKDPKCSELINAYCRERITDSGCSFQNSIASALISDKLTRNIRFSSTEPNLKCSKCSTISASKIYHLVHLDRHLRKGKVFPCFKCRKIFLAPFWFIQHQCLMDISNDSSPLSISPDITANYLYDKVDKNIRDMILTCPNLNCTKKYNFMSGIFGHLQLRTPCLLELFKTKKVEFEWNCSIDFEKMVNKVYKLEATAIQCDICNEICLSEIGYLMHVDHHRLNVTLECLQCKTEFVTICSFYSHACQTKSSSYCIMCDAFKKREAHPYIQRRSTIQKQQPGKKRNVAELAKSIEILMDEIMNYKVEDEEEGPMSKPNKKDPKVNNEYQNTFIDYLNSAGQGNHMADPGENIIDLSEDDAGSLNNSDSAEGEFDSIEDLLAESGDEYIEPDFEIKSEENPVESNL